MFMTIQIYNHTLQITNHLFHKLTQDHHNNKHGKLKISNISWSTLYYLVLF